MIQINHKRRNIQFWSTGNYHVNQTEFTTYSSSRAFKRFNGRMVAANRHDFSLRGSEGSERNKAREHGGYAE